VEKRLKKPQKPLGFSKTVVTGYLAPEAAPEHRSSARHGAQPGRPSVRLIKRVVDEGDDNLAPVVALRPTSHHPAGTQPIAGLVREWLAELKVMGRSEQTIKWYRQKMDWYRGHEGGPANLDGLTSAEVKRLLGSLIDRGLAPNTVHGFFEVVRAFANWSLREGVGCKYPVMGQPSGLIERTVTIAAPLALACIYGCLRFVLGLLVLRLDGDRDRDVELLLLRHELSVLRRTVKRPRLNPADRMIVAALARRLPRRAWGGLLVRPETVLGWHRGLVRRRWAAFGRRRGPGRPRCPGFGVGHQGLQSSERMSSPIRGRGR
jgi:hypothetical protein